MAQNDPGYEKTSEQKRLEKQVENQAKSTVRGVVRRVFRAIPLPVKLVFAAVLILFAAIYYVVTHVKQEYDDTSRVVESAVAVQQYGVQATATDNKTDVSNLNDWYNSDGSGDFDYTDYLLYMLELAEDGDENAKKSADLLLRGDQLMLSKEDLLYIFKNCSYTPGKADIENANSRMYYRSDVHYSYHTWSHIIDPVTGEWKWVESTTGTDVSNSDDMYGYEQGVSIEGETVDRKGVNEEGEEVTYDYKRFATHWQDVMTAAIMAGYSNYENWGNTGDANEFDSKDALREDKTDGYYINDETREKCLKLFNYKFNYLYDSITDTAHDASNPYDFYKIEKGAYSPLGYFFYKQDVEPPVNPHPPYYSFNTYYTPEAAPREIKNGFEDVLYTYCDIGIVPGYLPAGDIYVPPSGIYCCGRWDVVDPKAFVDGLSEIIPQYKDKLENFNSDAYPWYDQMLDNYVDNLRDMPYSPLYRQPEYYEDLEYLMDHKFIKLSYEGTQAGEYASQLSSIRARYDTSTGGDYEGFRFIYPLSGGSQNPEDKEAGVPEGWTLDIGRASLGGGWYPMANGPFHSYGVTFHGGGPNGSGNKNDTGEAHYGSSVVIVTTHVGGEAHYYPDVDRANVFIDPATGERYGIVPVDDGATAELLDQSDNLTPEEAAYMMQYLDELFGGRYPFREATQTILDWQDRRGQPVSAVLAFILSEGTYNTHSTSTLNEAEHWNFWNWMADSDEAYFQNVEGGRKWLDVKTQCGGDFNKALVYCMDKVVDKFWIGRNTHTFYDMSFNGYGFPTTLEDAKLNADGFYNCYGPWWETAFATTGDEKDLYPNRNARDRRTLLTAAGRKTTDTIEGKFKACADWYVKNCPEYNQSGYIHYDSSAPFGNILSGGDTKVREDCSGFASAFVSSLVPDMVVHTCGSYYFADVNSSVGQALTAAGWTLKPLSDVDVQSLPVGSILVDPGHHVEIFVSGEGGNVMKTWGWGSRRSTTDPVTWKYTEKSGGIYVSWRGGSHTYKYVWTY